MNLYARAIFLSGFLLTFSHAVFLIHWTLKRLINRTKWVDPGWWLIFTTYGNSIAWILVGVRLMQLYYGRLNAGVYLTTSARHSSLIGAVVPALIGTMFLIGYFWTNRRSGAQPEVKK